MDEQHRFGVLQRKRLIEKGATPDVLVMTATPIPRTLSLTLFGDLDISVIDEMPPGRTPVETRWTGDDHLAGVWEFVRARSRARPAGVRRLSRDRAIEVRRVGALAQGRDRRVRALAKTRFPEAARRPVARTHAQ